jgi:hypothetical protein
MILQYFYFSDFIHCGETQQRLGIANLPKQVESYNALVDLAVHVIDPVIDYFGMVKLTYGFCSHALSRAVPGRNDPKLDQHSAYERNTRGVLICSRGGAAVDFIVEDEDMREVAQWIVRNCPFDRLYFYGANQPVHVSYSGSHVRQVIEMIKQRQNDSFVPSRRSKLLPKRDSSDSQKGLTYSVSELSISRQENPGKSLESARQKSCYVIKLRSP